MNQNREIGTINGIVFVVAPVVAPQPEPQEQGQGHPVCLGHRCHDWQIAPVQNTGDVEPGYSDAHFFYTG